MSNETTPDTNTITLPAASTSGDKVQLAATTLQEVSKAFAAPGRETALSALKAVLLGAGAVAASQGWLSGDLILSVIGAIVGLASAGYTLWDDWRSARAVNRAASDAGLQAKLAAIDAAIDAQGGGR
jgi:hypothetical protein